MKKLLTLTVAVLSIFMSCKKDRKSPNPYDYAIDTRVDITLEDQNGNDLFNNRVNLDEVKLSTIGEKGDKPLPYEIDPTINVVSPEYFRFHPSNEEGSSSVIEVHFLYSYPVSTTIFNWNNNLSADTLRGEVVFDKKKNVVKLEKVFLNGEIAWTDQDGKDRVITIEKRLQE